jgi:flagellar motor switch protein FliM
MEAMPEEVWQTWHQQFARRWEMALVQGLRMPVKVVASTAVCVQGGEFLAGLPQPTCLYRLQSEFSSTSVWLDVNPSVLHPMLDRLLGGHPVAERVPRRPLTELELQLATRVLNRMVAELETGWSGTPQLHFQSEKVRDEGGTPAGLRAEDELTCFRFQIQLGDVQGTVSLGWPAELLQRVSLPGGHGGGPTGDFTGESARPLRDAHGSRDASVKRRAKVRVTLREMSVSREELEELAIGDIITTDHSVDQPLLVYVDDSPRFVAAPGVLRGRTAFRVLGPWEPSEEVGDADSSPPVGM